MAVVFDDPRYWKLSVLVQCSQRLGFGFEGVFLMAEKSYICCGWTLEYKHIIVCELRQVDLMNSTL